MPDSKPNPEQVAQLEENESGVWLSSGIVKLNCIFFQDNYYRDDHYD